MTPSSPLNTLIVIDRLEVGPVRVEKNRFVAPYTVVAGRERDTAELIYKYEEQVFQPGEAASQNLANVIAAQVALNYGLFCKEIVFRGSFDKADRDFLERMATNTAREIYVKKFLQPNPFLVGAQASLPVVQQKSYLQARLVFPDGPDRAISWSPTESSRERVAVSSSGGKDSLLSYGLLHELGYEVHPIFGNESGRHWFTAINAFRHFEKHVPHTTRVWMNSDRIFAWMLRHLPFIRKDFASVRSDEYPIRLWTVAVFTLGLLPLLRKRGVGRLVIGDEYDTSIRVSHKGVRHYDGLFDQSRYFDNALSRYYASKKWALSQFSILRPLSEFLIQKILVNRYPDLFAHQVSCHATHVLDSRVHPCGKCEKCRRIVGMVVAAAGDPQRCGYTPTQVEECLAGLSQKAVHQERVGAEHLMWVLRESGAIDGATLGAIKAREHPEILCLRFDRERSPMDGMPREMRAPLYRMFLEHAPGAVRMAAGRWHPIEPLRDPAFHRPYRYERSKPKMPQKKSVGDRSHILAEMTWPEARRRFGEVDVALLPVGAIEQHGPHLPLDTDAFDADYLAKAVAMGCSDPRPIVLPMVPYGVSYHHDDFSGTISINNATLSRLIYDIGVSAARNGVAKLVIINGHGGNDPSLNYAAQEINRDAHIFVCVDSGETSDVDIYGMIDTPNDVHAGEIETSTALAIRPELVQMDKAEKFVPRFSSRYLDFTAQRRISWHAYTQRISPGGVMGDPTKASAEKGRMMWDVMIKHLVAFVEDLKKLTLDEIFQKRY